MSQRKIKKLKKEIIVPKKGEVMDVPYLDNGIFATVKRIVLENIGWFIGIAALLFAIYANSLKGDFVSDDYATIPNSPLVGDFWYMVKNSASFSNYLVYKLVGINSTFGHHLTSVFLYLLICWLVYIIVEIIFADKWLSRITAILFTVSPIHVESVSWISGRIYMILAFYTLIAFLGVLFYFRKNNWKYLIITLIAFVLAFITDKPRPFALVFMVILYLLYKGVKWAKINWGKFLIFAFLALTASVIVIRPYVLSRINIVNSGTNSSGSVFYDPFFQYPTSMAKYLQLLWFPIDLTLYHTMYIFPVWLNWAVTLTYLAMLIYFYFKDKKYFFALAFIFAVAAPSMAPVKVSWLVAERYMFLGSLGFSLFLGLIIVDLNKRFRFIPIALFLAIFIIYSIRVVTRNMDWQTNHNLWVNTCQVSPNSHNAWNNIGDDYDKLKDYENAIKGFTQSTIVKPNYADAYHNRANIFYKVGRLDLARESYTTALSFNSGLYQTYMSLIQIDLKENKYDLAVEHAETVVKMQPNDPQPVYILAVVYAQVGKTQEAKKILTDLLAQIPNYAPARQALDQLNTMELGTTK